MNRPLDVWVLFSAGMVPEFIESADTTTRNMFENWYMNQINNEGYRVARCTLILEEDAI